MALMDWYYKTAFRLVEIWADQKTPDAQFHLGYLYHIGRGVVQDHVEAAKWYGKAADQGYPSAQFNLGVMYGLGQGVPQDDILAYMWSALSASRFLISESEKRDEAVKTRESIAARMSADQITEAQRLAKEWKPQHEKQQDPQAPG
jgi:uncharacterized protein